MSHKKTPILHARIVTGSGGGPEKTILNSPRFLRAYEFESACAYLYPPGDPGFELLTDRADKANAELIGIPDRGPFDWSIFDRLRRVCLERGVEVYHGHDYKTNLLGVLLRRSIPHLRLVTTLHGWVLKTWKAPLYYNLDKYLLRYYDAVVAVSEDLKEEAIRWRVSPEKLHLIHNAIDVEEFRRTVSVEQARARLGIPTKRLVIGGLGRLSKEKGFDNLIEAVQRLRQDGQDVELWIGGDGSEYKQLRHRADETDAIRLLGHLRDPKDFLQAIDIFALSSRREGLPNVVLEALAFGVPVVATRVAGIPSMLTDRENGLLVAPDDVADLASKLQQCLCQTELRTKLGRNGRQLVENEYSFEDRMSSIARIYEVMTAKPDFEPELAASLT